MRFNQQLLVVLVLAFICCQWNSTASAQMFGQRPDAQPGVLSGNERFLRGNRSKREFVGASRTSQAGFVGAQQAVATGRVRPATETLRVKPDESRRLNRPLPPQPASGLYYPRLELALDDVVDVQPFGQVDVQRVNLVQQRLQERVFRIGGSEVQLQISGSVAQLTGRVNSQRTADLLSQMVAMEPGIERVENQLQLAVAPPTESF
ncbi:MAG: hypothetical protein KF752_13940 [Pirellulaceae bacterium]|nr:hypothetical protein [Pirellulaceae bacterium]